MGPPVGDLGSGLGPRGYDLSLVGSVVGYREHDQVSRVGPRVGDVGSQGYDPISRMEPSVGDLESDVESRGHDSVSLVGPPVGHLGSVVGPCGYYNSVCEVFPALCGG